MKLSRHFGELSSAYGYEIEDLTYDSGGANVLASRLKVKRDQLGALLPMCEFDPVMVASAFHRGFKFGDKAVLEKLVSAQPENFPSWETVMKAIELEPWAGKLVKQALESPGGEQFLLTAAGLEYILSGPRPAGAPAAEASAGDIDEKLSDEDRSGDDGADDDGSDDDLGDAGEDYLNDQGFDRRS
jgi:hypothetical protein